MKTPTTDRWRYRKSKTPYHSEDEVGYEALAMAIIKQAVMDYRFADECERGLKHVKKTSFVSRMQNNAYKTKYDCTRFFKSQWYGILCDIPGDYILRRLKDERH